MFDCQKPPPLSCGPASSVLVTVRERKRNKYLEATPLGQLVAAILKRYGVVEPLQEARIMRAWKSAVGEQIAARAWPERLKGHVLTVGVANSTWVQELSFLKQQIISRLNQGCSDPSLVTDIRFSLASAAARNAGTATTATRPTATPATTTAPGAAPPAAHHATPASTPPAPGAPDAPDVSGALGAARARDVADLTATANDSPDERTRREAREHIQQLRRRLGL
ncbi:MAG: DUF721 domain-containing protein [Pseudomonadota bacterium]